MNSIISNAGFHHIAVRASDFRKSLDFYKGLGFTAKMTWGEGENQITMLDIGDGSCIELFANGVKRDISGQDLLNAGEYWHFAISVSDAADAFNKAIALGARAYKEPFQTVLQAENPVSVCLSFVYGPDGELIEFFQTK